MIKDFFCEYTPCIIFDQFKEDYLIDVLPSLLDKYKNKQYVLSEHDRVPKILHLIWPNNPEIDEFSESAFHTLKHNASILKDWKLNIWMLNPEKRYISHKQNQLVEKYGYTIRDIKELFQDPRMLNVVKIFSESHLYAISSDIARIFALQKEGGLYADLDYVFLNSPNIINKIVDSYWVIDNNDHKIISNYLIGVSYKNKIVDEIASNIYNLYVHGNIPKWMNKNYFPLDKLPPEHAIIMGSGPGLVGMSYYLNSKNNPDDDSILLPIHFASEKVAEKSQSIKITIDGIVEEIPALGIHLNHISWQSSCHNLKSSQYNYKYLLDYTDLPDSLKYSHQTNFYGFIDNKFHMRLLDNYPPAKNNSYELIDISVKNALYNKPLIAWIASFGYGGVEPDFPLIRSLANDFTIAYYTAPEYMQEVLKAGAFFVHKPFGSAFLDKKTDFSTMDYMIEEKPKPSVESLQFYIEALKDSVLILYEYSSAYVIQNVAKMLKIPAICTFHGIYPGTAEEMYEWIRYGSFYQDYRFAHIEEENIARISKRIVDFYQGSYNDPSDHLWTNIFHNSDMFYTGELMGSIFHYNIRYFPKEIIEHSLFDTSFDIYNSNRYNLSQKPEHFSSKNIFVTLGTAFNNRPELFDKLLDMAIQYSNWHWIFHTGYLDSSINHMKNKNIESYNNIEVYSYINEDYIDKIFKNTEFLVYHGGGGTFYKSLQYNLPSIVLPLSSDHFYIAKLVENKNFGCATNIEDFSAHFYLCLLNRYFYKKFIDHIDVSKFNTLDIIHSTLNNIINQDQDLYYAAHAIVKNFDTKKDIASLNNKDLQYLICDFMESHFAFNKCEQKSELILHLFLKTNYYMHDVALSIFKSTDILNIGWNEEIDISRMVKNANAEKFIIEYTKTILTDIKIDSNLSSIDFIRFALTREFKKIITCYDDKCLYDSYHKTLLCDVVNHSHQENTGFISKIVQFMGLIKNKAVEYDCISQYNDCGIKDKAVFIVDFLYSSVANYKKQLEFKIAYTESLEDITLDNEMNIISHDAEDVGIDFFNI